MKHEIKVYAYIQDGGDGGGNTTVYGSLEELKEEEFKNVDEDDRERMYQSALEGDNPYEDGQIDEDTLVLEEVDGKLVVTKPITFHWGQ